MPGYFLGVVNGVKDEAVFGAYQGVAMPTIEQCGGKMAGLVLASNQATAVGPPRRDPV